MTQPVYRIGIDFGGTKTEIIALDGRNGKELFRKRLPSVKDYQKTLELFTGLIHEAEAAIADLSRNPKGSLRITAPLGIGRRLIASGIPEFHDKSPDIEVRVRLSDHNVDILAEGVDVAFKLGVLEDSNLRMRGILKCERVLCASPEYLARRGTPRTADALIADKHDCLLLRYPGSKEYYWTLVTAEGPLERVALAADLPTATPQPASTAVAAGAAVAWRNASRISPGPPRSATTTASWPVAGGRPRTKASRWCRWRPSSRNSSG